MHNFSTLGQPLLVKKYLTQKSWQLCAVCDWYVQFWGWYVKERKNTNNSGHAVSPCKLGPWAAHSYRSNQGGVGAGGEFQIILIYECGSTQSVLFLNVISVSALLS